MWNQKWNLHISDMSANNQSAFSSDQKAETWDWGPAFCSTFHTKLKRTTNGEKADIYVAS